MENNQTEQSVDELVQEMQQQKDSETRDFTEEEEDQWVESVMITPTETIDMEIDNNGFQ